MERPQPEVERKLGPSLVLALVLMALALLAPGCTTDIHATNGPAGVEDVELRPFWCCPEPSSSR